MSRNPHAISTRGLAAALLLASAATAHAQAPPRPQPTCIRDVALGSGEDARRATLVLRDGRVEAVLAVDAPAPPGTRIVEGEGLLCLPAFLDAYTRTGTQAEAPVKDQDRPVDTGADVRIDMRLANRKGIRPAFRVAEALAIETKASESWREAGFGAALVTSGGELLSGTSCLATTRDAAMRDVVLVPDVFATAGFGATGPGYPSTLMGYMAQLRQFFLDARRHAELVRRYEQGRPGPRPPFDAELEAGTRLLAGELVLLCEADGHRDVERWLKLADEFGLEIALSGGRDAWRVADLLAARGVPVLLTLDWGKEVDDPRPKAKEEEASDDEPQVGADAEPDAEADAPVAAGPPVDEDADEDAAPESEEAVWEYTEPLGVRVERRLRWEEGRDCALRLHEAGVRFAFGSGGEDPDELLGRVRDLVEAGLPADVALAALTTTAADLLGVSGRVGEVRVGGDATLALWDGDPLTDEKARVAWIFVDGFPTEFEREEEAEAGAGPAEGVDATGTWTLRVEDEEGEKEVSLVIAMDESGEVSGELTLENPMDQTDMTVDVTGQVTERKLTLEAVLELGDYRMEAEFELELEGDAATGDVTYTGEYLPQPLVRSVEGTRGPAREVRRRDR